MSEPVKPKRHWFQFQLSTAIMMMFVMCGFVFVNFQKNMDIETKITPGDSGTFYGFPFVVYFEASQHPMGRVNSTGWRPLGIFVNTVVAIATVISFALTWEFLIRRRTSNQRLLQLHLSTLVLLTVVAGGVMWANFRCLENTRLVDYYQGSELEHTFYWGWPWVAAYAYKYPTLGKEIGSMNRYNESGFLPFRVIGDVLAAAVILTIVAVLSEYVLRRRESRKL